MVYKPNDPKNIDILGGFLCLTSFFEKEKLQKLLEIHLLSERVNSLLSYLKEYEKAIIEKYE